MISNSPCAQRTAASHDRCNRRASWSPSLNSATFLFLLGGAHIKSIYKWDGRLVDGRLGTNEHSRTETQRAVGGCRSLVSLAVIGASHDIRRQMNMTHISSCI